MSKMKKVSIKIENEINTAHIKNEVHCMEEENIEDRPKYEAEGFNTIFIKEEMILSDEEFGGDVKVEATEDPLQLDEGSSIVGRDVNTEIYAPVLFPGQGEESQKCAELNSSDLLSKNIDFSTTTNNKNMILSDEEFGGVVKVEATEDPLQLDEGSFIASRESNTKLSAPVMFPGQGKKSQKCAELNSTDPMTNNIDLSSTNNNKNVCKICDRHFKDNHCLQEHNTRIHSESKPYKCDICDKRFSYKSSMKEHIATHSGNKPFICEFCDRSFFYKSNLNKHIRIHTGKKPYNCETCDKKFIQKCDLKLHIRFHTGEKPYNCEICERSFSKKKLFEATFWNSHWGEASQL